MNEDIRLKVGFLDNVKTQKTILRLGWPGIEALFRLWFYAAENKPDGQLEDMDLEGIEIAAKWKGSPGALGALFLEYRWLDEKDGRYSIHDWKEHNPYAFYAKQRKEQAQRAAEARWMKKRGVTKSQEIPGHNADSNTGSMPAAMLNDAGSNAPVPVPSPVPDPVPVPVPVPKDTTNARSDPLGKVPSNGRRKKPFSKEEYFALCRKSIPEELAKDRDIFLEAYPGINLEQQAAMALSWLLKNPKNRKSNLGRFLSNWLGRAQERATRDRGAQPEGGNDWKERLKSMQS